MRLKTKTKTLQLSDYDKWSYVPHSLATQNTNICFDLQRLNARHGFWLLLLLLLFFIPLFSPNKMKSHQKLIYQIGVRLFTGWYIAAVTTWIKRALC